MSKHPALLPTGRYNDQLEAQVHPPAWVNPRPAERYNLVVIGAGTAGLVSAAGAAGLGAKVALVEKDLMGGDCLNVGCVPSKGIIQAARAVHAVREADRYGVRVGGDTAVDFPAVMERMRRIRAELSQIDSVQRFTDLGVDVFLGEAAFSGPHSIRVGEDTLHFKKAVIATGARPVILPIEGLQGAGFLTNETLFSLTALPPRLLVVGSGPIGCEMAQTFQRFGSQVTLVDLADSILPREDREAGAVVRRAIERDGVDIHPRTTIKRVQKNGSFKEVTLDKDGQTEVVEVDEILLAIGRKASVDGLQLEKAGIYYDARKGVQVDDHLQTSNPDVYAAGDSCLKYQFTHTADAAARIVIQNALFRGRRKFSALHIPWCTYTDPEIAHVGLSKPEAEKLGLKVQTFTVYLKDVDRARLEGADEGFVRIHTRKGKDRILGATIVAPHAGEMIGELTVAMTAGMGLAKLASVVHPYPTVAEAIRKVGDQYNRSRLSPFVARILKRWLAWNR